MEKNISKASLLFSKRKNLVSEYILTFLNEKEQLISARVNKNLLKATKMLIDSWPKKLEKISQKFNIDLTTEINKSNIDINIFKHIMNKRAFHISDTKSNFIQILLNGKYRYFALANGENWAWSNDTNYWKKINLTNSTLGMESYELLNVCWLDLILNFKNVKPGKYKVFLRQGLREYDSMKNSLSLKILIINNNVEHLLFETQFMDKKMRQEIYKYINTNEDKDNQIESWEDKYLIEKKTEENLLTDCYVTTIEIPDFDFNENNNYLVQLRFFQTDGNWKRGWIIDGAILEKI